MVSKSVVDRLKSNTLVAASAHDNETRLATNLFDSLGLPAEVTRALLQILKDKLVQSGAELEAADHAHNAELRDDDPVRAARDQAAAQTSEVLCTLRDTVLAAYGEAVVAKLGLDGRLPSDPAQLRNLGSEVGKQLASWTPPENSLLEGYSCRPEAWSAKLSVPVSALTEALAAVAREKREADATQVAKNRAIEKNDKTFTLTANILSALLEAAGESELARKVRPSRRRAGQTVEAAEETTEVPAEQPVSG